MKVLYTASVLSHICQFHLSMMNKLKENGWEIYVAARDNLSEKNGLQLKHADKLYNIPFQRFPLKRKNLKAYKELKRIINTNHYDLIICNTPMCSILTRMAAKKARKNGTKVIYIAHGFHFYTGAPLKYWMIYPIEKWFANHRTDLLITITNEDFLRAKKKFKCRVAHMHGVGVDSNRFHPINREEQDKYRKLLNLGHDDFVILCTGELNENKNQETLIRAIGLVKNEISNVKLLIAGNGPLKKYLEELIGELKLTNYVTLLGYRTDLEKIVPCVDLIATASFREGLPLNVIEGMLCGKPVLASINRGHKELIKEGINGNLFVPNNIEECGELILNIYKNNKMISCENIINSVNEYMNGNVLNEFDQIIYEFTKQREH